MIAEQRPARHRGNGNAHEAANDKGYLFSGFLFVLLAGVAAAGYWQVSELHKTLADTRQVLEETRQQLSQVTGQVSQTGETMAQSDSSFRSELKVVNSEIRKLWDVSNKRNRQWITENRQNVEKLQKLVSEAAKQASDGNASAMQAMTKVSEINQVVKALAAEQLVANSSMTSTIDALQAEIVSLKEQVSIQQTWEKQIQASNQTQEELSRKFSSFQSQVSQSLLQMENTVRDLVNPKAPGLTIQ